jgi:teichuronic acid biosynthesis glycosyltransferase TuaC
MRVLHLTNAYPYPENPIYGIFIKEQIESLEHLPGKNTVYFINAKGKGKWEYFRSVPKIIKLSRNFEIIHCHHLLSAILILLLKPFIKPSIIVSFMSDGVNEILLQSNFATNYFREWAYQFVIEKSDARIFKKDVPNSLIGDRNSFYLPNGVNTSIFKPIDKSVAKREINLQEDKDYILFVSLGDLHRKEKRYDKFQEVVRILKEDMRLKNIEELHLTSTPREKVVYFFNAAVLHLLTSDFEGSPNSVKEALACNVPVVCTDVGNLKTMFTDTNTCKISASGSAEDLAQLVAQIVAEKKEENLRDKLIANKLDSKSTARNLSKIYELVYRQR